MTAPLSLPAVPAIVTGSVTHVRRGETSHRFRHRVYQWLVDLDQPPLLSRALRPFVQFRAVDHMGSIDEGGCGAIKSNVLRFIRANDVDASDDTRVLMLANARVLGYVFDPLTVYWCLDGDRRVICLVAEVHNTYGERTAYLLHPDESGRAEADKHFYVSPFNDVSGRYRMQFTMSPLRVGTAITLVRASLPAFSASFDGVPSPATSRRIIGSLITKPLMPQRVSLLIAAHGIWLWLRRLPVVSRPIHVPPKEV